MLHFVSCLSRELVEGEEAVVVVVVDVVMARVGEVLSSRAIGVSERARWSGVELSGVTSGLGVPRIVRLPARDISNFLFG